MKNQTTKTARIPKAPDDEGAHTRVATAQSLGHYQDKLIHCKRPADLAKFKAEFFNP
jgi:hypothetical protein